MDLTNDILRDKTWDLISIHSPLQQQFKPPNNSYNHDIPFAKARKLFVHISFHWVVADGYINEIITVIFDHKDWSTRGQNTAPHTVHTVFRPTNTSDPLH